MDAGGLITSMHIGGLELDRNKRSKKFHGYKVLLSHLVWIASQRRLGFVSLLVRELAPSINFNPPSIQLNLHRL